MRVTLFAWRNLWRRKRRTLITGFSIGFGIMLAVTFTGTGDYGYTNMINAGANMGFGHVTIERQGYNLSPGLDKPVENSEQVRDIVLKIEGVNNAYVRIMGQAMFASANKTVGGMFLAVHPKEESAEHNLFIRSMVSGEMLSSSDNRDVVIGTHLAKKLNLRLGKKLIYTTTDANGEIVSAISRVTGIFETGVKEIDGGLVMLPINTVRNQIGYKNDEATLVAALVNDQRYTQAVRDRVARRLNAKNVEILTWKQTQGDMAGIVAMDRGSNYISQILIGLLIAAGIFNTLLMSVLERRREFGIMMAVGMTPATLFKLIMTESLWLAAVGIIFGVIITTPWYWYLYNIGIDFTGAIGDDYSAGGVLVDPVMKIRLFKESIISILSGVFLLTLASGLYPAWKAGHIPPVQSLMQR
ncbi:MAG: FtsX-like permease family protein [Gammaproteobacteria bacterium]|nr:FtsX-like permease family protein [Gammaproteobacteria bacterium]